MIKKIFSKFLTSLCLVYTRVVYKSDSENLINYTKLRLTSYCYSLLAKLIGYKFLKPVTEKKSNTVFIVASGESVAQLSDSEWMKISNHDAFSVNFAILHDYPFEKSFLEPVSHKGLRSIYEERMEVTKGDVILSFNYLRWAGLFFKYRSLKSIKNNILLYLPVFFRCSSKCEFIDLYSAVKKYYSMNNIQNHCAHVGAVVDYAVVSGYINVVLLGVDLNGGKYFTEVESRSVKFQPNKYYQEYNQGRVDFLKEKGHYFGEKHPSMNEEHVKKLQTLTAYEYFKLMKDIYKRDKGVNLFVYNQNSKLAEFLPIYSAD